MALDLLFPKKCIGCGKEGQLICNTCRLQLPRIAPPVCPLCGRPQSSGVLCPGCVSWKASIDGIRSPFRFEGLARQAVYQLKYRNLRTIGAPLAAMLYDYRLDNTFAADVLVPVPLHPKRLRERGYNQSAVLAKELSRLSGLPVESGCLVRAKHTLPQARTQTVEERRSNVIEAYTCTVGTARGKKVLLIDDVSTSGATLDACAAVLKLSGAESVWGLTFAREI